jgi:hypothetical protein
MTVRPARPRLVACLVALAAVSLLCRPAHALREGDGATWGITTRVGPDAQVPGWFINLGLTGARARIPDDRPRVLEVTYVFEGTPAHGRLRAGDQILGANGRVFTTPHKFGYGVEKFGYEGPMMAFGNALEQSQTRAFGGRLLLGVVRDGRPQIVHLQLPTTYGAYAATYPYDCPKTDRILGELYAWLLKEQRPDGTWHGRPHINAFAALALMGSPDPAHRPAVEKAVRAMAGQTSATIDFRGLDCWKYTLYGIVLAEYDLLTGEAWVRPELEEINTWLAAAQAPTGGWGHRPWIEPGTDTPHGNGYGPFNIVTMQAKMAWSLMMRCGLEVNPRRYASAHEFVARGTNAFGYVWYADGGAGNPKYADMGRTGAAALAHDLSPAGGRPYRDYALRAARCIGDHPQTFPDTHGSPLLGMVWTALGAAVDPPSFRRLMDHNRWCFSLAHCPDGTFYYQPNRDNNAQDYAAAPRLSATAATALVFSAKYRRLQMTGAPPAARDEALPKMSQGH